MGIAEQEEFNIEKPLTKRERKLTHFTDTAIAKWKPKGDRDRVGFPLSTLTKAVKIIYREKTQQKYWELTYHLNNRRLTMSLGPFIPEERGTEYLLKEMSELRKKHMNIQKTKWLTDPWNTINERNEKVIEEAHEKRIAKIKAEKEKKALVSVNNVIEDLCIAGFPKAKIKDEFLSAVSIRTHINKLIGNNKRTDHLSYAEDQEGNGKIFFKPGGPQSFPELFEKYPPGVGIIKSRTDEVSLYDTDTGRRPIRELTNVVIDHYLRSKDRSQGQQENILLAFQCLWTWACKMKIFGEDVPNNPTSRRDGRIIILKNRKSKAPGRSYNEKIFKRKQIPILIKGFETLSPKFPFQAEALNMSLVSGRRRPEVCKLRWEMLTEDSEGNPIILMPGGITKMRTPAIINITPSVQLILDRLREMLEGPYKAYRFVPYLFPTTRINKYLLSEQTYLHSDHTRIKNWDGCWRAVEELTGIKGSPKMFRKTKATYDEIEMRKRYGKDKGQQYAIALSDHDDTATAEKHYWKVSDERRKELADISDKIFFIPRAVKG